MYVILLSKEWGKFLQDHLIYEENKYTHIGTKYQWRGKC